MYVLLRMPFKVYPLPCFIIFFARVYSMGTGMRVPVILRKSHLSVSMKGILRKYKLTTRVRVEFYINLNVTKSMYFFPKNINFLSISFIKANI